MIDMLIILLILSFSGIFLLVVYGNHLDKRIDELVKKIDTLQYQTDDVLHDIDVVNKNIRNYYGLLRRVELNLESLWHDTSEEPQEYPILCRDKQNNVWIESDLDPYVDGWDECVEFNEIVSWIYINDLLPSYNKAMSSSGEEQ